MSVKKAKKMPIDPDRVRTLPAEGFSWIDRRFVREGFVKPLGRDAVLLYLFLIAVSDAQGISFYGDPTLGKLLKLTLEGLTQARAQLINQELIIYQYPLYQVLPLPVQVKHRPCVKSASTVAPHREVPSDSEDLLSLREFRKLKDRERSKGEDAYHGKEEARPNQACS